MNTNGFYKVQNDSLFYASNAIYNSNYELFVEHHETYTYPVDGWYYFESEELAREFFGLPAPIAPESE